MKKLVIVLLLVLSLGCTASITKTDDLFNMSITAAGAKLKVCPEGEELKNETCVEIVADHGSAAFYGVLGGLLKSFLPGLVTGAALSK